MTETRSFSPALFQYLNDLERNNERPWFQENQDRYERSVREPALQFIEDFAPRLETISPYFVADSRKVGGSLFRIQRDVRFTPDKTPYKTSVGIQFRHSRGRDVHAPGFYLHLEPGACFAGLGIWHPDGNAVRRIREAIDDDPDGWQEAAHGKRFTAVFSLDGDRLKRPPKGFDADHPLIEDLKFKDYVGATRLTHKTVTSPGFLDSYATTCRAGAPFMAFLCTALDLPF